MVVRMANDGDPDGTEGSAQREGPHPFTTGLLQVIGWLIVIGGGAFSVWKKDAAMVAAVVTGGLATVLIARLHEFEVFKGGGFELKLRKVREERRSAEAAQRAAEAAKSEAQAARADAVAALDSIREVGTEMTAITLSLLAGEGVYGKGETIREKIHKRDRFRALLEKVGASREQVDAALAPFNAFVRVLLATLVTHELARTAAKAGPGDLRERILALVDFEKQRAPSLDTLEALLETNGLTSPKAEALLAELRQFEATGTVSEAYTE